MTLGIILILIAGAIGVLVTKNYKKITLGSLVLAGILSITSIFNEISLTTFYSFFFILIAGFVMWESFSGIGEDLKDNSIPIYYAIVLVLVASLCGIIYFDNLIIIYLTLEISAFLSAGLVIIKDTEESTWAGLRYLFLSLLASVFFLIGVVIFYRITGALSITGINENIILAQGNDLIGTGLIFVFIGLAFKSALFPFHIWLPDAHGSATSSASAMLSAVVLKSYIILFIKILYIGIGINLVKEFNVLKISLILGTIAMLYGSVLAIMQENIKYRIAYSSVAQIGYIFMGIGLGNSLGLMAALFHIIAHGVSKSTLFLAAGNIIQKTGIKNPAKMNGLARILPYTMAVYTVGALSMIGIPLFVGFVSKWNFGQGIMEYGSMPLIVVLTLSSLLNGIYFMPLVIRGYFFKGNEDLQEWGFKITHPLTLLASLIIITGVFSSPIIEILKGIVGSLY